MSQETKRGKRTTKGRAAATPPPARSRPVQSEGKSAGKSYAKTQAEYAEQYGKPILTIKRWWKRGLPLDDPDLMGEYLSPRGRKPEPKPDDFEAPSIVPPAHDPYQAPEDPLDTSLPIGLDESFFAGQGVLAAIERLQKAERERAAAYFACIRERGAAQVLANRFREWIGIVEALRKLEKDAPEIRRLNGKSVDRAEIERAVGETFGAFRAAANNLPGRAAAKLEGITAREEIEEILEREMEVLLRTLTELTLAAVEQAEAPAPQEEPADA